MPGNTGRLDSLQAMRAVAALLVVAMHSMNMAAAYSGSEWVHSASSALMYVGHFGVDIFFVLSGFVIAGVAAQSGSIRAFLFRRVARVYPLFWLSLAAMIALRASTGHDDIAALVSRPLDLVLLHAPAAHPVAWTLTYEVQFYLVTALLMLAGSHLRVALMVWIVAEMVLVTVAYYGLVPRFALSDALSLEFCMGVALALFGQRLTIRFPLLLAAAALLLVVLSGVLYDPSWIAVTTPARAALWGVPATLLVWSAISAGRAGHVFPKWSIFLGDISYSIYMWHLAAFTAVGAVLVSAGMNAGTSGALMFLALSIPVAMALSWASYFFFELPITKKTHRATKFAIAT